MSYEHFHRTYNLNIHYINAEQLSPTNYHYNYYNSYLYKHHLYNYKYHHKLHLPYFTVSVPAPPTLSTVYPCAAPLPSPGPTYGDYADSNDLGLQNSLFYLITPQNPSASASECCKVCLFGFPNCVRAYYFDDGGCLVTQAANLASGSGMGISTSCPAGTFNGLSYGPDVDPTSGSPGAREISLGLAGRSTQISKR
ncbi:hypothetical protein MMC17_003777 [Xylographa soralifera]|nr:hypothetical protein [Xylographa soralifera]